MRLVLTVDGPRWRAHLEEVATRYPGIAPVCKGNGYGLGLRRLARRAQWLDERGRAAGRGGVDTVAVGTYAELDEIRPRFDGDLLVLTPWRPFGPAVDTARAADRRVVHTVSRPEDLDALLTLDPRARYVLERRTSMLRHGLTAEELWQVADGLGTGRQGRLGPEGVALHLPLQQGSHLPEVRRLMEDVVGAGLPTKTVWLSHLTSEELDALRGEFPDHRLRPRTGTELWLGDRGALRVTADVLDVHPVRRGERYGYRRRPAPRAGHVVVVSGGTAHGIGLEAPSGEGSLRSRLATLARGGLDAAGLVRSPFTVGGRARLFAEPPHMQASMLFLPAGAELPAIGDRVEARVRFTATVVDRVEIT